MHWPIRPQNLPCISRRELGRDVQLGDRHPLFQEAVRSVLEGEPGLRVLATAGDGIEALHLLRQHPAPIHLVFTDVVMSRLGGHGLYQIDRREGRTAPFLFTSGYTGRGGEEPLDPSLPFLPKPWTSADLLARVRQTLDSEKASDRES